jgi:hypothetical protein
MKCKDSGCDMPELLILEKINLEPVPQKGGFQ